MRYSYKKNYTWNPYMAYFAGLVAADGCLANDDRHINITSSDIDLLETIKAQLSLGCSIGKKKNGFGGYGYFLQFSDVALYDFLLNAGITPAKSKTIRGVNLPDKFYGSFLLGLFDGDGTIYGFWDRRWKNSLMYYVEFTCASEVFLEWLHERNVKLIGVQKGKIKKGVRAFKLVYAKRDSRQLFMAMYQGSSVPSLKRKRSKFIDFLVADPYASSELRARVLESVDRPA